MAYLSLREINKIYPNGFHAVHDFNLDIEQGEFICLVGPSGCGKSTTLRMIAGLENISKGDFLIDGVRANEMGPREREIAMVFQSYALYPHMSVYDNLAFGLSLQGVDEDIIDEKVNNIARILGLTDYLDRKPRALSGGQRQRVAVGRAIIRKVGIFLMDEPLSNLDAKQRVTMRSEITDIHRKVKQVNIPSYLIKAGDVIEIKENKKSSVRYKQILEVTAGRLVPEWLDVDAENLKGSVKELPSREVIDVPVNEMLIVELYSK